MKTRILIFLVTSFLLACKISKIPIESESESQTGQVDITHPIDFIELDKFENLYIVHGAKLLLLDTSHVIQYRYENDRYGNITSIDVSNPQKILVFYDDFDIIILLDNTLSDVSQINLNQLGFQDIVQVAISNDNKIWIYDPISFQLKKIDQSGIIISESTPLYSRYVEPHHTSQLVEQKNLVYLADTLLGVLVFDNFAQYIKTIPLKGLLDFQIKRNQIIYHDPRGIVSYNTQFFEEFPLKGIDISDCKLWKQVRTSKENLYISYTNGVKIIPR